MRFNDSNEISLSTANLLLQVTRLQNTRFVSVLRSWRQR